MPDEADYVSPQSIAVQGVPRDFPDPDLLPNLIDNWFTRYNPYLPLLHRPTFEQSVAHGLHLRDLNFANVLLLVCSIGARYCSNDERVRLPGSSAHSAGWRWYAQGQIHAELSPAMPCVYDLQRYAVSMFLLAAS